MDDLDKEMKLCFIDEARQLLESAEQCFLDLESNPGSPEVIENIFRLAHNMKGTSRAVGFGEVAEFTHQLENLLLKLKEGTLSVDAETANLLLECNDHLKVMVEGLSLDLDAKFDSRELIEKICVKLEGGSIGTGSAAHIEASVHVEASDHAEELFEELPQMPPAELFDAVLSAAPIQGAHDVQPAPQPAAAKPAPGAPPPSSSGNGGSGPEESIRVSLSRLEKLSNFIGELVILQTVLNQHRLEIPSQLLQRTVSQLGKLSKEIQDISMSLRMIPLKQTFAKLQRIVRDTSKALGKEVELNLLGEQTEVDKTVLEQVSDPLVHIVRNAIDHGLESTADRIAAGKPAAGKVEIHAFHQGNNLVIEVRDDGKGIDPQRLLKKAVEKGLLSGSEILSNDDALKLIFHPGFSTKDQVTEISGRGVGLDVVKTNVERLGGQVNLESEIGKGSCFKIVLPLTLAIIDAMVVQCGDERYVVPVANVHESVQPREEDVHFVTGRGEMLNLRDQVLPLLRLSHMLKAVTVSSRAQADANLRPAWQSIAIIVNSRKAPFAVLVDDIIRQQQIVIKKLGAEIRVQKGMAGSAILGDGRPALILDLNDLLERIQSTQGGTQSGSPQIRSSQAA
jgi:two-component system, chemotaxis family, sensor kinase CheA